MNEMNKEQFQEESQNTFTKMAELAFEFVNRNTVDIDGVYIFVSLENGYFFNVYYKVNGHYTEINSINNYAEEKFDLSMDRMFDMLDLGTEDAEALKDVFEKYDEEVPKSVKLYYHPKTESFEAKLGYDVLFTDDAEKTAGSVFDDWLNELRET